VSTADPTVLDGGTEKQTSRSSNIGSEAPYAGVSLCNRKHTTTASSYGGGGAERLGGGEGAGSAAVPPGIRN
jgi:hypothetical protein